MKFHPPIEERENDELIEIANFPDRWQPEAIEQAKTELKRRGVSSQEQEKKVEKWRRDYQAELKCEMKKRALVTYHPITLLLMFIRLPATLLWGWNLKREGYLKLHKQRLGVIASGLLLYLGSISYLLWSAPAAENERLRLIQEQDISEWEKSYYGEACDSIKTKNSDR